MQTESIASKGCVLSIYLYLNNQMMTLNPI